MAEFEKDNTLTLLRGQPQLIITEQPQSRGLRFRYQCENRGFTPGSILGADSNTQRRSYPTFEIRNYRGPAKVVIFCVTTEDRAPRLHPHRLVGHEGCTEGVCEIFVDVDSTMAYSIKSLGIQCIRRKDIEVELRKRELRHRNPFGVPMGNPLTINLNAIRLCFELYVKNSHGQFVPVGPPVLSSTIYDKKASPSLAICSMSASEAPATGGKQIILLTEKINRDDIQVRFFKDNGPDEKPWIAYGKFNPATHVHKQFAIVLRTPAYCDPTITEPVTVQIQLERKQSLEISESLDFKMLPVTKPARKRSHEGYLKVEPNNQSPTQSFQEVHHHDEQQLPNFDAAFPQSPFSAICNQESAINFNESLYEFCLEDIFDVLHKC